MHKDTNELSEILFKKIIRPKLSRILKWNNLGKYLLVEHDGHDQHQDIFIFVFVGNWQQYSGAVWGR
jgi:hypothetical protein